MLQNNHLVAKYFIIGASMLNILCLRRCSFRAYPQYAVHAIPAFLVGNIKKIFNFKNTIQQNECSLTVNQFI